MVTPATISGGNGRVCDWGAAEVREAWMGGRTIVLGGAKVITMGPEGDLVGDIVIRDDRTVAVRA